MDLGAQLSFAGPIVGAGPSFPFCSPIAFRQGILPSIMDLGAQLSFAGPIVGAGTLLSLMQSHGCWTPGWSPATWFWHGASIWAFPYFIWLSSFGIEKAGITNMHAANNATNNLTYFIVLYLH
jgi:hypothetical protein